MIDDTPSTVPEIRSEIRRRVGGPSTRTRLHKETVVKLWCALNGEVPSSLLFADPMYKKSDMERRSRIASVVGFEYDPETARGFNKDELVQILGHIDRHGAEDDSGETDGAVVTDGGDDTAIHREQPVAVTETVPNGGRDRDGSHRTLGRWTFEYTPAREFVEDRLRGRVLNACAGKTRLNHNGEIVRNDLNPERDAELHHDVATISEHLPPGSFDTVVFDPPFDDLQADDKYDGLRADDVLAAFHCFNELLRGGGHVITFGWNSWGMSSHPAFERQETVLFQRGACLRDVIATVDERTSRSLTDGGWS